MLREFRFRTRRNSRLFTRLRLGGVCLYDRKHPEQANLPGFQQTCYGPWINIWPEDGAYLAYWSLENACHAGFPGVSAKRAGQVYRGDNFTFEWH